MKSAEELYGNESWYTSYTPMLEEFGEIRALSDIGLDRLERNGEISIENRQNFATLPKYLY